jgi:hypothetical protein
MIVLKAKKKRFNLLRSKIELSQELERLPNESECFKFISNGGFSSASFIAFVAEKTKINNLYASTFRVGKKRNTVA